MRVSRTHTIALFTVVASLLTGVDAQDAITKTVSVFSDHVTPTSVPLRPDEGVEVLFVDDGLELVGVDSSCNVIDGGPSVTSSQVIVLSKEGEYDLALSTAGCANGTVLQFIASDDADDTPFGGDNSTNITSSSLADTTQCEDNGKGKNCTSGALSFKVNQGSTVGAVAALTTASLMFLVFA